MSGILRLESLTKGNTLKQGDKTPLKYRLFDADGEKLNIAGKSAKVRLVYPDFLTIGYEKDGLTVAQDDTVTFTIDKVIPAKLYHVEIIVDNKFIFPSRSDESKFTVDKSSLGTEANIIEIVGVDAVVRKAVDLINVDPSLIIDEDKLVTDIISNTGIGSINDYYQAFNDLKPRAELSISKSAEALTKSQNALNVANGIDAKATNALSLSESADTLSKSVQEQFNQVVIDGDSSVEAAQARVDASGQTNATLKERLDKEHTEVTSQLAHTNDIISGNEIKTLNYTKYGEIDLPSDFPVLPPFELYRDFDGLVKHDFDINDYIGSRKVYWSAEGNNKNDGLTTSTPVVTWPRLMEVVSSVPENDVNIVIMDKFFSQDNFDIYDVIELNKNLAFTSNRPEGTLSGTLRTLFSWTADGGIWKTARTAAIRVYDYRLKDRYGLPKELKKVDTIDECRNLKNSWYTDGSEVWVNSNLSAGVSNNIAIGLPLANRVRFDVGSHRLVFDNIQFFSDHASGYTYHALEVTGNANGMFIGNKVGYRYASFNGFASQGVGTVYHFDSHAIGNGADGFNYHGVGDEFIFEYNIYSKENGDETQGSANATTGHDGMALLRINSIGEFCYGPLLADVGGCYSIAIDCRMYDSLLTSGLATKAAFYFSDTGASAPGKAILINCDGGGEDTFTIYAPTTNPVKVVNLGGNNIRMNSNVEFVESAF